MKDKKYAKALSNFLLQKKRKDYSISIVTEMENLEQEMERIQPQITLCDENMRDELNPYGYKILVLTEDNPKKDDSIFKYCSAETILKRVEEELRQKGDQDTCFNQKAKDATQLHMIVSFLGATKTKACAHNYAQQLSLDNRILLLQVNAFLDDWEDEFTRDTGMMQLLYHIQRNEELDTELISSVTSLQNDYEQIGTMGNPDDILSTDQNHWCTLLKQISKYKDYDVIVFVMQTYINGLFEVLSLSDQLYVWIDNQIEEACLKSFYGYAKESGYVKVCNRVQEVYVHE